jgi:predicted amidophosphoribosyltransferase
MPPSKREDDPDYDARLVQVLEKLKNKDNDFKYEEVLANKKSRKAAHSLKNEPRPTKDEHLNNFIVENNLRNKNVEAIVIFDDVIYSGASFKAAKEVLKKHYGPILICGLFIARHIGQEEGEPDSRLNLAKH